MKRCPICGAESEVDERCPYCNIQMVGTGIKPIEKISTMPQDGLENNGAEFVQHRKGETEVQESKISKLLQLLGKDDSAINNMLKSAVNIVIVVALLIGVVGNSEAANLMGLAGIAGFILQSKNKIDFKSVLSSLLPTKDGRP